MTNPAAAMRMLITYAICIPLAITMGYMLTNPLDFGTLGMLGLVFALILSPVFIKWHYPIMVFGLGCPAVCFFLVGKPPLWQVVVILSLGIAIVDRALSSDRQFIRVPVMTWPLLFILAVTLITAQLTGGIGLRQAGSALGGGKKYLCILLGIGMYFALSSRPIPKNRRNLYIGMFMLAGLTGLIGDLFPVLPSPLNYINILFPPTLASGTETTLSSSRMGGCFTSGTVAVFLLAKYGLRGVFMGGTLWRPVLFIATFSWTLMGGFRSQFGGFVLMFGLLFFMEGLHHTRFVLVCILAAVLGFTLMGLFSDKMPFGLQRAMSFLPLKWKYEAKADADASSEWRYSMWRALWPKVPQYLLLGKGYAITEQEYQSTGSGTFAMFSQGNLDPGEQSLAISTDYHSGPLTTLIPFGLWGGIGILWLMGACLYVLYHNYHYGDPDLKTFNAYLLVTCISSIIVFFFIFGGYNNDVVNFAKMAGFSVALNGGLCRRPAQTSTNPRFKPLPGATPEPA